MKAAALGDDETLRFLIDRYEQSLYETQLGADDAPETISGIDHELDLFGKDKKGRTALDWARLGRHQMCVELLESAVVRDIERQRVAAQRFGCWCFLGFLST